MGYYSTAQGSLVFSPELSPELANEAVEHVTKTVTYPYWVEHELTPGSRWDAYFDGKLYSLESELTELAKFLKDKGVLVNGTVEGKGEDAADIWRIVIKDGVAVKEMAIIRWPDGTAVSSL